MEDEKLMRFVGRMMPILNEKQRRLFLGSLSDFLGRGTATKLQSITKVSRVTINRGREESKQIQEDPRARPKSSDLTYTRSPGAGRKSVVQRYPDIKEVLLSLLNDSPESPLCWTTKSLRNLEELLKAKGYDISFSSVQELLQEMGFSLQQNPNILDPLFIQIALCNLSTSTIPVKDLSLRDSR